MINLNVILVTAVLIEIITLFVRFVLKINARGFLIKVMKYFGLKKIIRVHHFFLGWVIVIIAYFIEQELWFNLGLGIVLSDVLHHLILQIVVGSHEVEFIYWLEKETVEIEKEIAKDVKKEVKKIDKNIIKETKKLERFLVGNKK